MQDVTLIVKTFQRPDCLRRLMESVRSFYPTLPVIIADDGETEAGYTDPYTTVIRLPFDTGLSAGRNAALAECKTPYFLLVDDDFIFIPRTDIGLMRRLLEQEGLDILAGALTQDGGKTVDHYEADLVREGPTLRYVPSPPQEGPVTRHDLVFNFFLGQTDRVSAVGWEPELKLAEHTDFFLRAKAAGLKVGYCPLIVAEHGRERPGNYGQWRRRGGEYFKRFMALRGLTRVENVRGEVTTIPSRTGVTFLITTFGRKESLFRLLMSIARHAPDAVICIADDGKPFDAKWYRSAFAQLEAAGLRNKPTAWNVGWDKGLSYKRNFLVAKAQSPFVLILEDDFIFTEETDVSALRQILEHDTTIGIAGGGVRNDAGNLTRFVGDVKYSARKREIRLRRRKKLDWSALPWEAERTYARVGVIPNFFLARRVALLENQWDPDIKIHGEHSDFFLRFSGWGVAYVPSVTVEHAHFKDPEYEAFRRRKEFLAVMLKKWNADRLVIFGTAQEPDGQGGVRTYRAYNE
ncbi:MAG: glycosyltransferase [Candidatus Omnitrophota bacterium]|nr:glycosyltransferase [Candidatus Omnitrophota bacterium]